MLLDYLHVILSCHDYIGLRIYFKSRNETMLYLKKKKNWNKETERSSPQWFELLVTYSNALAALENNCLKRTCLQSPELKFRVEGSKEKKKNSGF